MRILHLQNLGILTGVQRVCLDEMYEAKNISKNIFFEISTSSQGDFIEQAKDLTEMVHFNKHLIPNISLHKDLMALLQYIIMFCKRRPDVVHTHSSKPGVLGRIAARITGVPVVVHTVHGFAFDSTKNKLIKIFYQVCEKFAAKFCDKIIVLTASDFFTAEKILKIARDKIVLLPNAIRVEQNKEKTRALMRQQNKRIGFLGRLVEQKNPMLLIEAIRELNSSEKEKLEVVIGGDGHMKPRLEEAVFSNLKDMNIEFKGWVKDVDAFLREIDALIVTSSWEGMPLNILEAFNNSTLVICSDIPGNKSLVTDYQTGILFKNGSSKSLAKVLKDLLANKIEFSDIVLAANKKIDREHNLSTRTRTLLGLYSEVLNEKL